MCGGTILYLVIWRLRILLPFLKEKTLSFHVSQGHRVGKWWTLCLNLFVLVSGPTFLPVLPSLECFLHRPENHCFSAQEVVLIVSTKISQQAQILSPQLLKGQEGPSTVRMNRLVATRQEQPCLFVQYAI